MSMVIFRYLGMKIFGYLCLGWVNIRYQTQYPTNTKINRLQMTNLIYSSDRLQQTRLERKLFISFLELANRVQRLIQLDIDLGNVQVNVNSGVALERRQILPLGVAEHAQSVVALAQLHLPPPVAELARLRRHRRQLQRRAHITLMAEDVLEQSPRHTRHRGVLGQVQARHIHELAVRTFVRMKVTLLINHYNKNKLANYFQNFNSACRFLMITYYCFYILFICYNS